MASESAAGGSVNLSPILPLKGFQFLFTLYVFVTLHTKRTQYLPALLRTLHRFFPSGTFRLPPVKGTPLFTLQTGQPGPPHKASRRRDQPPNPAMATTVTTTTVAEERSRRRTADGQEGKK